MERLKSSLETLYERINDLEDKIVGDKGSRREEIKKIADGAKHSRTREAAMVAIAQKVASRLDQTIEHVESILRN